jgi:hypothetical protein
MPMSLVSIGMVRCISSVLLGLLLALSMRQKSRCYTGYIAIHIMIWWLCYVVPRIYACLLSPDSRAHRELNQISIYLDLDSSAPRIGRTGSSRAWKAFLYSAGAGVLDALTLQHTYSCSDKQILAVVMTLLVPKRFRVFSAAYTVYLWYAGCLPAASDIVAMGVLLGATWLGMAQPRGRWMTVRFLSACVVATQAGGSTCATKLSAFAPATIIVAALFVVNVSVPVFFAFAVLGL